MKFVQRLTDELVFRIRSWVGPAVRTEWGDAPGKPLEDQLNDVVAGLLVAAVAVRRDRLERAEHQRRIRVEETERLITGRGAARRSPTSKCPAPADRAVAAGR